MYGKKIDTLNLQISYDTKLDNATYDAIKAFQINTVNSGTSDLSDIVNSKIRDIEAAANSFFTSIGSSFNMVGYNSEILKEYVPALVFTMYDGFYIYSPFENTLDDETAQNLANNANAEYTDGQEVTGLKPYIYYSCRYKTASIDVVITYSLDNYITVQGTVNGGSTTINDAGYLINGVQDNGSTVTYRGITIGPEGQLTEYLDNQIYSYIKINGVKYYYDPSYSPQEDAWFRILNGQRVYRQGNIQLGSNDQAYRYYKEAAEFRQRLQSYGLLNLKPSDAVDVNGNQLQGITDAEGNVVYDFVNSGTYNIFDYESGGVSIEEPTSNFNSHRMAVIRYVIESNLSVALSNYNTVDGLSYNFRMPKLAEEDWDKISSNVCLISFLQGLSIGGKMYNGYSVVNNNKNEEVVTEDSIYITTSDGYYHKATSQELVSATNMITGVFNIDFERKSIYETDAAGTQTIAYYYPKRELGCYTCYVSQTSNTVANNIYEYMDSHPNVASIYYTALARERYSMYKVFRNPQEHLNSFIN